MTVDYKHLVPSNKVYKIAVSREFMLNLYNTKYTFNIKSFSKIKINNIENSEFRRNV